MTTTPHQLLQRTEGELGWTQRRSFLQAAAAWTALGGWTAAIAQQRSNIVDREGDLLVNGQALVADQPIATGDRLQTGPGGRAVFVLGGNAFLMRQNTRMTVEPGATSALVGVLRLVTGAVASVWSPGGERSITTPTVTAGIRGTGLYTEVFPEQDNRSYFCNCYGTVDLTAGAAVQRSQADYHQAFWAEPALRDGRWLTPARALNHSDAELEMLARLVGQQPTWQRMGRKGSRNGSGSMTDGQPPPADPYGNTY